MATPPSSGGHSRLHTAHHQSLSPPSAPSAAEVPLFHCSVCNKGFRRLDHQRRHTLVHLKVSNTSVGKFECDLCSRSFARGDSLQRHQLTHQNTEPSLLRKGVRACQACQQAKARCSGGTPCDRCLQRSVPCIGVHVAQSRTNGNNADDAEVPGTASAQQSTSSALHLPTLTSTKAAHLPDVPASEAWSLDNASISGRLSRSEAQPAPFHGQTGNPLASETDYAQLATAEQLPRPASRRSSSFPPAYRSTSDRDISFNITGVNRPQSSLFEVQQPSHENQQNGLNQFPSISAAGTFPGDFSIGPNQSSSGTDAAGSLTTGDATSVYTDQSDPTLYDADPSFFEAMRALNWHSGATPYFYEGSLQLPLDELFYQNTTLPRFSFSPNIQQPFGAASSLDNGQPEFTASSDQVWPNSMESPHMASTEINNASRSEEVRNEVAFFVTHNHTQRTKKRKRGANDDLPPRDSRTLAQDDYGLEYQAPTNPDLEAARKISDASFEQMSHAFDVVCTSSGGMFTPFTAPSFVSKPTLELFVSLYFKSFQPYFPIFHVPTFSPEPHWLLLLAIASVGCHYVETFTENYRLSLHEFLRRTLVFADENPSWWPTDEMLRIQIKVLYTTGTLYCGDQRMLRSRFKYVQDLADFCVERWQFPSQFLPFRDSDPIETQWKSWVAGEIRSRTGYCIWLLNCMWSFHFAKRQSVPLRFARPALPAHESLFDSPTAEVWKEKMEEFSRPPSLHAAVQSLYDSKRLSGDLGEFARSLLAYANFDYISEVAEHWRQGFSRSKPSRRIQAPSPHLKLGPVLLPAEAAFSEWRNSACDSLETISWAAPSPRSDTNIEQPTVLHLHLVRIIILSPWFDMIALARSAFDLEGSCRVTPSQKTASEQNIRKWATKDPAKARQAVIHAGALWWHIRRFSVYGFYEPLAVAFATLILWGYATFRDRPVAEREQTQSHDDDENDTSDSGPKSQDSTDVDCDIILLDRPIDNELKETFMRSGQHMFPHLAGVGCLHGSQAPERVVLEGQKILYSLNSWGIRRYCMLILDGVLELTRQLSRGASESQPVI